MNEAARLVRRIGLVVWDSRTTRQRDQAFEGATACLCPFAARWDAKANVRWAYPSLQKISYAILYTRLDRASLVMRSDDIQSAIVARTDT
jgi:hypothetical protein